MFATGYFIESLFMRRLRKSIDKRIGRYVDYWTEYPLAQLHSDRSFSVGSPISARCGIPPVVYQTWESNRFGKTHLGSLQEFQRRNPDLAFCLLDANQRDAYMEQIWGHHPIHDVYTGSQFGPMKVDAFRYCLLFERGGYYFDINKCVSVPLQSLHDKDAAGLISFEPGSHRILPSSAIMPKIRNPDRFVAQWGFGFERGSPVLERMIALICEYAPHFANKAFVRPKNAILQLTGPGMFTKAFWSALEDFPDMQIEQLGVNFDGKGDRNMPGSHVRYHTVPNYDVKNKPLPILILQSHQE